MRGLLTIAALTCVVPDTMQAEELYEPFVPVRPKGMGGAGTALSNDHNSVWSNPAGIGRIRKARARSFVHFWSFPAIVAGANSEGQSLYTKLQSSGGTGTLAENINEAITTSSNSSSERPIWARLSVNPIVFLEAAKNAPLALSAFGSSTVKMVFVQENGTTNAQMDSVTDVGGTITLAWTNRTNRFNLGVQIRPTIRYAFDDKVDIQTLTDKSAMEKRIKSDANVGSGIGADIGVLWTFADFWFPTFGMAIYNLPTGCKDSYLNPFTETRQSICGTVYNGSINNPESLFLVDPMDVRVGISITPRLSRKVALRFAIDMHHLYIADGTKFYGLPGVEPLKQSHAGIELFFGNPLKLNPLSIRAGVNQGLVTAGISLRISFLTLEVATYGVDISSDAEQIKDQRTLVSISGDF